MSFNDWNKWIIIFINPAYVALIVTFTHISMKSWCRRWFISRSMYHITYHEKLDASPNFSFEHQLTTSFVMYVCLSKCSDDCLQYLLIKIGSGSRRYATKDIKSRRRKRATNGLCRSSAKRNYSFWEPRLMHLYTNHLFLHHRNGLWQ